MGHVGFGQVRFATDRKSKQLFAVKTLLKDGSPSSQCRVANEVAIHLELEHPHVATLRRVHCSPEACCLVLDYFAGGSLADRLQQCYRFEELQAAEATHQMLSEVYG